MTKYQKAIKVRKTCENHKYCSIENECPYFDDCKISEIICYEPCFATIRELAKAIQEEKWNVK